MDWTGVGAMAAIIAAIASLGTLIAILRQVLETKKEARTTRTIQYLSGFNEALRRVRDARKYKLPPVFETNDRVTFNLATELLHVTTDLAIAYEKGVLDKDFVDEAMKPSYEWLNRAHGSVPQNMYVSEGRFPEVGKILSRIKPELD